jgi:hypothetical protein
VGLDVLKHDLQALGLNARLVGQCKDCEGQHGPTCPQARTNLSPLVREEGVMGGNYHIAVGWRFLQDG